MSEQAWDWRKFWRDTTEGGYRVVAVYRNPDGRLLVVGLLGGIGHAAWIASSEGIGDHNPRSYSLVPVVKEPEYEAWAFREVRLDLWYSQKGCGEWQRIEVINTKMSAAFLMSFGNSAGVDSLFRAWECTAEPLAENPVVQPCGKLKGVNP